MPIPAVERIDAHQHFWNYDPEQYPWIPTGSALHRDWLPADLAREQKPLGIHGTIAVQARQSIAESEWLLALAEGDDRIRGVVGWVDLQSEAVEADLALLSAHRKFVGVRHVVQDEPDDRFLLKESFLRGISKLRRFGLTYDLLIYPRQLPAAIELVRLFPEQRFVLDHIAKPEIRNGSMEPWREQIHELASSQNVWCKVSGMVTEADHHDWKPEHFRPYLDVVLDAFGTGRTMWGSDWPVCLLAADYAQVFDLVDAYTRSFSEAERTAVFGGNAQQFYLRTP